MTPEQAELIAEITGTFSQRMAAIEDELERAHEAFGRLRTDLTALQVQFKLMKSGARDVGNAGGTQS